MRKQKVVNNEAGRGETSKNPSCDTDLPGIVGRSLGVKSAQASFSETEWHRLPTQDSTMGWCHHLVVFRSNMASP